MFTEPIPTSDLRQHILSSTSRTGPVNWKRVAYSQLVTRYEDVCNTVMQFAELTREQSPAQKVLMYPRSWDDEMANLEPKSRHLETSMRLLQKASRQYKVKLSPMKAIVGREEAGGSEAYPISNLLMLTSFDRVLNLASTGLVLDAELLDTLFSAPMNSSVTEFLGKESDLPQATLLKPSMATYQRAIRRRGKGEPLKAVSSRVLLGKTSAYMVSQTSSLRSIQPEDQDTFNATTFYDTAAYVRFSDGEVLGPEYDIPGNIMRQATPEHAGAKSVWDGLYDRFRVERMNVCGLDLEPMPREKHVEEP